MTNKFIYILISLLCLSFYSQAQQERKHIRQGNRAYEKAIVDSLTTDTVKYQDAEVDYRKALDKDPNNWDASYNLANALYKQGKYEDATKQFQAVSALDSGDKNKTAMAFHNLGNSYLQSSNLEEAIEAYKNSLRQNPKDMETKYNLAWAQNKLKEQQQQQQNQDQNKEQDQDKQEEEQDQEQQQNQDQEQQQNEEEQQQNQQQKENQEQQQQAQQQQISKEDAMRILEALQNDEKEVQDKVQKQKAKPKKRTTEKDW